MPSNACALKEALMRTSRINNWFESFGRFQIKHRELDGAAVTGVTYSFSDELKATAGAVFVLEGPDEPGTYGVFKDLSCVRLGATYSF